MDGLMTLIETITPDQLDLIAPLWRRLNALHQDLDEMCGGTRRNTTWEQRLIQLKEKVRGKCLIQVVRSQGEPAGYCFTSINEENKGAIDSLFVVSECRRKGFGKGLMAYALKWLADSECKDVEISVHPGNTNAIAFYWSFGFATGCAMKRVTTQSLIRTFQ